uniref:Uncharacterized protein n=1 Tax=Anguilla anguilla TaxID=7936 RepID=A0A0E9WME2_ANGAN
MSFKADLATSLVIQLADKPSIILIKQRLVFVLNKC